MKPLRCAIYTRKSSEEGLEQGFNSLHAQRDACSAYILSQTGEGWTEIPTIYDDGGYSGGSMDRPGVQALLADIHRGLIDTVVVYKVDRLTRSLADFARIVELFDKKNVSFVSVTQAFNTTTSMGRLTLNVLLSFAQFEREVTGERIRDKIAASKKKGLWMGGRPPLGYDGVDAKLVLNAPEAETVQHIFSRYLHLGAVSLLESDLATAGIVSKRWLNKRGEMAGGGTLTRGALRYLLQNPVYRGTIRHRDKLYPDAHPEIIDETLWCAVQARLKGGGRVPPKTPRLAADILLKGKLFDARGGPMAVTHTARHGRRYRYYVGRAGAVRPARIAVGVMDGFVQTQTTLRLRPDFKQDAENTHRVREALVRVSYLEEAVQLRIRHEAVTNAIDTLPGRAEVLDDGVQITIPITLKHRQSATIIDAPQAANIAGRMDRALVRGLALARSWAERLASGQVSSLKALALSEGYCEHYAARLLPLAWLAPDLVETILAGEQPMALSLGALVRRPLPLDWAAQRALVQTIGRRTR